MNPRRGHEFQHRMGANCHVDNLFFIHISKIVPRSYAIAADIGATEAQYKTITSTGTCVMF